MLALRINRLLVALRAARPTAVLIRLVVLVAGWLALWLMASRSWDASDAAVWLAAVTLLVVTAAPDTLAPLMFVIVMVAGWMVRGPVTVGWPVLWFALLLGVVHLGCALAGQFPTYAVVPARVLTRWLPAATMAGVVTVLAAGFGAVIRGSELDGAMAVTVAALLGLATLLWLVSRDVP